MSYIPFSDVKNMWIAQKEAILADLKVLTPAEVAKKHNVKVGFVYNVKSKYGKK